MNRRKRQRAVEKWGGEEKGGKYGNDRRDKKRLKEKANDMKGRANKGRIEKRQQRDKKRKGKANDKSDEIEESIGNENQRQI